METRSLDRFTDLAEGLLDAGVMVVALSPAFAVLAAGKRVRAALTAAAEDGIAEFCRSACAVPPDGLDGFDGVVSAASTGLPPPLAFAASVPLRFEGRTGAFLVFSEVSAVQAQPFRAIVAAAQETFGDAVRADGHRADLARYTEMLDHMERVARIGVWELDLVGRTLFWSDEVFRLHQLVPGPPPSIAEALVFYPEPGRVRLAEALRRTEVNGELTDLVMPFTTAAGDKRVARVIASRQDGGTRIAGVFQDVTSQEAVTEQLWWTANHDVLTGLPNRRLFGDRFRNALRRCSRSGRRVVLVLVDVDHFKAVNDTLGHAAGDELLRIVAAQLKAAVRDDNAVARTGGDEFSILLEEVRTDADLGSVLAQIGDALSVRLVWGERTMNVTLSAGAALAPDHARTDRELTAAADIALYRSKEAREGTLVLFESAFGQALQERSRLLAAVRQALDEGRIVPWYQPQIDVVSGRIVGVEALARWITQDGVKTAAEFVSAISDHEIGARIGAAVVDRAIAEIAALNAPRTHKIALAINASAGELVQARFLERIGQEVSRGGGGGPITVEIGEDVILDDPDGRLTERLEAASAAGVRFSLDDVGSGDGSLLSVSALPISEVKIARRFVSGLGADPARQKVVRGIIDVARSLDIRVIVEGVETEAEVTGIVALGGRYLQGFFYSQAVPLPELHRLLGEEEARLDAAA